MLPLTPSFLPSDLFWHRLFAHHHDRGLTSCHQQETLRRHAADLPGIIKKNPCPLINDFRLLEHKLFTWKDDYLGNKPRDPFTAGPMEFGFTAPRFCRLKDVLANARLSARVVSVQRHAADLPLENGQIMRARYTAVQFWIVPESSSHVTNKKIFNMRHFLHTSAPSRTYGVQLHSKPLRLFALRGCGCLFESPPPPSHRPACPSMDEVEKIRSRASSCGPPCTNPCGQLSTTPMPHV